MTEMFYNIVTNSIVTGMNTTYTNIKTKTVIFELFANRSQNLNRPVQDLFCYKFVKEYYRKGQFSWSLQSSNGELNHSLGLKQQYLTLKQVRK